MSEIDTDNDAPKAKYEIELATGKKITLRGLQVGDSTEAAILAGERVNSEKNAFGFGAAVQEEMFKRLILAIDGKTLTGQEKKLLRKHLTGEEYIAAIEAFGQIAGNVQKAKINFMGG